MELSTNAPWMGEPDHVEFRTLGYPCIIHRNDLGALCGYVGVPPGHPAHGKIDHDVDVEVHGGLTYANPCMEDGPICHKPEPGEPDDIWWLGFDCAHCFDIMPKYHGQSSFAGERRSYRNITYVTEQIKSLAAQLKALESAGQTC